MRTLIYCLSYLEFLFATVSVILASSIQGSSCSQTDIHFNNWLNKHAIENKLVFPITDECGNRGIGAAENLTESALILSLPLETSVLSPKAALGNEVVQQIIHKSNLSDGAKLFRKNAFLEVICLIAIERAKGDASKFADYFRALPQDRDGIQVWTELEMKELQDINDEFTSLRHLMIRTEEGLFAEIHKNFPGKLPFSREDFLWASFISRSRSVGVPALGGNCLVPMFDMANHHNGPIRLVLDVAKTFENGREVLQVFLQGSSVQKGQSIFHIYGEHDNAYLLKQYGFVMRENHLEKYVLQVDLTTTDNGALMTNGKKVQLKRNQKPAELLDLLRGSNNNKNHGKHIKAFTLTVESLKYPYVECQRLLLRELRRFPTTEDQDRLLLDQDQLNGRYKTAIMFRALRKRILLLNVKFCEEMELAVTSLAVDHSLSMEKLQIKLRNVETDKAKRIFLVDSTIDTKC